MSDLTGGAANDIGLDGACILAGQLSQQARLAGADLAKQGDMALATEPPAIQFQQFLFQVGDIGRLLAQFGDACFHAGPIRNAARGGACRACACRAQQLPAKPQQRREDCRRQHDERHAQQQGHGLHAFVELEQAVEQADGKPQQHHGSQGEQGKQDQAQRQARAGHAGDCRQRHRFW
jgi:hypothetical protein